MDNFGASILGRPHNFLSFNFGRFISTSQLGFEIETSNVNGFGVGIPISLDMLPPQ